MLPPVADVSKYIVRVERDLLPSINALNISINHIIPPNNNKSPVVDPRLNILHDIENPNDNIDKDIIEKPSDIIQDFELPPTVAGNEDKQAMKTTIVIRRKKMKKHKLRKWRKRYYFEVAKRKQRRMLLNEKEFQASLLARIKEGEKFSAEEYVRTKLEKAKPIKPNKWFEG